MVQMMKETDKVRSANIVTILDHGCRYVFSPETSKMTNFLTQEVTRLSPETFIKVDKIAKKNILALFNKESDLLDFAGRYVDKQPYFQEKYLEERKHKERQ